MVTARYDDGVGMQTQYILRDYYDNEHDCITPQEIRAFLLEARPYTPMWMIIVLALTTGMRCNELLRLSMTMFENDLREFRYRVSKPSRQREDGRLIITTRHRRVVLEPWVVYHLRRYCDLNFTRIEERGTVRYWTPYRDHHPDVHGEIYAQKLFPWTDTTSFEAVFAKVRKRVGGKGFNVRRVESMSRSEGTQRVTLVCRFHKFRHFALSYHYHTHAQDLKTAQMWIKHRKSSTTDGYVHSLPQMGMTVSDLQVPLYALLGLWPDGKVDDALLCVVQRGIHDYYT